MRFIFGILVGIVLTIGAAYVGDAMTTAPSGDQQAVRHMVNWDVVDANLRSGSETVQDLWARLLGKAREIDKKTGI